MMMTIYRILFNKYNNKKTRLQETPRLLREREREGERKRGIERESTINKRDLVCIKKMNLFKFTMLV